MYSTVSLFSQRQTLGDVRYVTSIITILGLFLDLKSSQLINVACNNAYEK